jgi:hypothetical protein
MRYCTSCRHLTTGTPLFCTFCGHSFDVRLCPRLHANPRGAQVCAQCGSRDLSQPQARGTWLSGVLHVGFRLLPGVVLWGLSLLALLAFLETILTNQQVQGQLIGLLLMLGIGWWVYMQIPGPIKRIVQRAFKGRKSNGGHGHQ